MSENKVLSLCDTSCYDITIRMQFVNKENFTGSMVYIMATDLIALISFLVVDLFLLTFPGVSCIHLLS